MVAALMKEVPSPSCGHSRVRPMDDTDNSNKLHVGDMGTDRAQPGTAGFQLALRPFELVLGQHRTAGVVSCKRDLALYLLARVRQSIGVDDLGALT